jgi:hypothetical protein
VDIGSPGSGVFWHFAGEIGVIGVIGVREGKSREEA